MQTYRRSFALGALAASFVLNACARPPESVAAPSASPRAHKSAAAATHAREAVAAVPAADLPRVLVHKSPTCGCCGLWVEHLRRSGFTVEVRNEHDVNPTKERLGVPYGKGSCHTAEVGGYFIEGHVPAEDIKRLLAERPAGKGLTLPGMPAGSPGMEMPDGRKQAFEVELVTPTGSTTVYARHNDAQQR